MTTTEIDDWTQRAECRGAPDPEIFFPLTTIGRVRSSPTNSEPAKEWCKACPVVRQCLEFALDVDAEGVWGGVYFAASRARRKETQQRVREGVL